MKFLENGSRPQPPTSPVFFHFLFHTHSLPPSRLVPPCLSRSVYAKKSLKWGVKGKGGGYLIYKRGLHSAKKSLKRGSSLPFALGHTHTYTNTDTHRQRHRQRHARVHAHTHTPTPTLTNTHTHTHTSPLSVYLSSFFLSSSPQSPLLQPPSLARTQRVRTKIIDFWCVTHTRCVAHTESLALPPPLNPQPLK